MAHSESRKVKLETVDQIGIVVKGCDLVKSKSAIIRSY